MMDWAHEAWDKGPTLVSLLIGFLALRSKLVDIHLTMNSRLDKLIIASEAVGAQRERDRHTVTVPGIPNTLNVPPPA